MKMSELEEHAQQCLKNNLPLQVLISMPNFNSPELITNPPENIIQKVDYYKATYDENCNHKRADGISIVDVVHDSHELKVGEALLPCSFGLQENHIRVEDSYVVDSRSKSYILEGRVEDVMQVLKYIKAGEGND